MYAARRARSSSPPAVPAKQRPSAGNNSARQSKRSSSLLGCDGARFRAGNEAGQLQRHAAAQIGRGLGELLGCRHPVLADVADEIARTETRLPSSGVLFDINDAQATFGIEIATVIAKLS